MYPVGGLVLLATENRLDQVSWCMPEVPANRETGKVSERLSQKHENKRAGGVAEVSECLLTKQRLGP
jgi:hypothetical protein